MKDILLLIGITLLPFFELRASIPYGLFATELSPLTVFVVCVSANILLAPFLFLFLDKIMRFFLKSAAIEKIYQKTVLRAQHKVHKYVNKYGLWGLAIFIGIPLPGSGVYTAALGAYLLGFSFKDFFKASIIGVLIAGVIVFLISITGIEALSFLIK